ncbi:MAG: hypothetical protein VKK80_04025 [Prochlorothrix sp.]|nr:hypothetical protein [Prochlorothrix sp.]
MAQSDSICGEYLLHQSEGIWGLARNSPMPFAGALTYVYLY